MIETPIDTAAERRDALAGRLMNAVIESMDIACVHLGSQLGYYRALRDGGPATSTELATRTGTNERYTREWLEQQAVTGILEVTHDDDPKARRYALPAGHDEVLTDTESLSYMAPFPKMMVAVMPILPALIEVYRTGGGVPYADFGREIREGIAEGNRAMFLHLLASEWIPAMPDIHARLQDNSRPARVADVGCGTGWSSIALARGYPAIHVDGIDLDAASVADATVNVAVAGLADRVTIHYGNAAEPRFTGRYDLACAFECIHDMADPVGALRAMRDLVGPGGTVLIADEHVQDAFTAPGDPIERLMYGFSVLHCLTVAMADGAHEGTGTVIRSETMRAYANAAGYQAIEILPIENDLWRFYRLTA